MILPSCLYGIRTRKIYRELTIKPPKIFNQCYDDSYLNPKRKGADMISYSLFLSENLIRISLLFSYEQQVQIRSILQEVQVLLG